MLEGLADAVDLGEREAQAVKSFAEVLGGTAQVVLGEAAQAKEAVAREATIRRTVARP